MAEGRAATVADFAAIERSWRQQQATLAPRSGSTHPWTIPKTLLMDSSVVIVGRHVKKDGGSAVSFDMNGVQIKANLTGTTALYAYMAQVQKAQGNTFQVFNDGVIQPLSRFNTSKWQAGQVTKVEVFPPGSLRADAVHSVTIVKDTEPQFAGTTVMPNFISFFGFSGDNANARLVAQPTLASSAPQQHRVEFLGDSITAGFDDLCDIPGSPKGFPWSESFTNSWATLICDSLGAECHYNAWSGFGMAENCCGGSTLASDVWLRTLATVGSANASDPHGTTPDNEWNFSTWIADAVVINLGTNDHLGSRPSSLSMAYKQRYLDLVVAAAKTYGNDAHFFLACGPMATDYCDAVHWVIANANAQGIRAHFLDQRGFEDGKHGPECAYGHPGSQIDAAMAKNGSAFIRATMGW
jgi:hypothetical protein